LSGSGWVMRPPDGDAAASERSGPPCDAGYTTGLAVRSSGTDASRAGAIRQRVQHSVDL